MSTLDDADRELIVIAGDVLREHFDPDRHTTGVALRTDGGDVYTGVSLKAATGAADVHAEPIAVGRARLDGASSFDTVVAVQFDDPPAAGDAGTDRETHVVSPCGACREVLARQSPDISVVVPGQDGPIVRPLAALLPH